MGIEFWLMLPAFVMFGIPCLALVFIAVSFYAIMRPLTTFACIFLAAACVYTFGHRLL